MLERQQTATLFVLSDSTRESREQQTGNARASLSRWGAAVRPHEKRFGGTARRDLDESCARTAVRLLSSASLAGHKLWRHSACGSHCGRLAASNSFAFGWISRVDLRHTADTKQADMHLHNLRINSARDTQTRS